VFLHRANMPRRFWPDAKLHWCRTYAHWPDNNSHCEQYDVQNENEHDRVPQSRDDDVSYLFLQIHVPCIAAGVRRRRPWPQQAVCGARLLQHCGSAGTISCAEEAVK